MVRLWNAFYQSPNCNPPNRLNVMECVERNARILRCLRSGCRVGVHGFHCEIVCWDGPNERRSFAYLYCHEMRRALQGKLHSQAAFHSWVRLSHRLSIVGAFIPDIHHELKIAQAPSPEFGIPKSVISANVTMHEIVLP